MDSKECTKCIHNAVCKTAESCDGYVPGCKHFKEGWISVKDRLPEVGCDVLFVCRSKEYGVGAYSDTYKDFFMGQFPVKGVTHWMPLPQLPKGE